MANKKKNKKKEDLSGLGIPAGLFIGMGIGFLANQLVARMFIGLGFGFILFIILRLIKKSA